MNFRKEKTRSLLVRADNEHEKNCQKPSLKGEVAVPKAQAEGTL